MYEASPSAYHGDMPILEKSHSLKRRRPQCDSTPINTSFTAESIGRFPSVGDYASYCRCVDSTKVGNGKRKVRLRRLGKGSAGVLTQMPGTSAFPFPSW
jgi:hypothetical protein